MAKDTSKPDRPDDDEDLHAEGLRIFKFAMERDSDNRRNYADDIRFARLGEQWPEAVRKQREAEGRPCLTINRLPAFIRQVTNDARQNKPAIKFHAVGDGADQWTAKVQDGLARNIEYSSNADVAYDTALDNAVSGGYGYFRICTDYAADDVFDQDIRIERIANSLTVVPDAYCDDADSANWNDAFLIENYSLDEFRRRWPKADESCFEGDTAGVAMPAEWMDGETIQVAEWWRRREVVATLLQLSNGQIMFEEAYNNGKELFDVMGVTVKATRPTKTMKVVQHIMNGAEIIETNEWAGKYIPIVPVYGDEVIVDGKRHLLSLIRFAKDPQQMMNYWRTTSTELVALAPKAPFIGEEGAFDCDPNWYTANNVSHPFLQYKKGTQMPQRQAFQGPPAAALQEAMNASDDMKAVMGLYDASLGARSNESSGRAIMARQREGDVSTFNFTDNLSRAIRHAGRIICDLIPKVYSSKRVIRTIGEDGSTQSVAINQHTQPIPEEAKELEQKQQAEGIMRMYDLTNGKYDVTCEAGPSFTTRREEAAAQMTEYMRANPAAGPLIGDLLAKNLDWPGADEIAARLKSMLPPQAQGKNPALEQAGQQIQMMQAEMQQLQQKLADAERDKQIEVYKARIDAFNADTKRIQVVSTAMGPEQIQALVMQTMQQAMGSPDITPAQGMPPPMPPQQPPMPPQAPPGPPPDQMQPPQGGFFTPDQPQGPM